MANVNIGADGRACSQRKEDGYSTLAYSSASVLALLLLTFLTTVLFQGALLRQLVSDQTTINVRCVFKLLFCGH